VLHQGLGGPGPGNPQDPCGGTTRPGVGRAGPLSCAVRGPSRRCEHEGALNAQGVGQGLGQRHVNFRLGRLDADDAFAAGPLEQSGDLETGRSPDRRRCSPGTRRAGSTGARSPLRAGHPPTVRDSRPSLRPARCPHPSVGGLGHHGGAALLLYPHLPSAQVSTTEHRWCWPTRPPSCSAPGPNLRSCPPMVARCGSDPPEVPGCSGSRSGGIGRYRALGISVLVTTRPRFLRRLDRCRSAATLGVVLRSSITQVTDERRCLLLLPTCRSTSRRTQCISAPAGRPSGALPLLPVFATGSLLLTGAAPAAPAPRQTTTRRGRHQRGRSGTSGAGAPSSAAGSSSTGAAPSSAGGKIDHHHRCGCRQPADGQHREADPGGFHRVSHPNIKVKFVTLDENTLRDQVTRMWRLCGQFDVVMNRPERRAGVSRTAGIDDLTADATADALV